MCVGEAVSLGVSSSGPLSFLCFFFGLPEENHLRILSVIGGLGFVNTGQLFHLSALVSFP